MAQYDFFIAGRWRNKDNIKQVLDAVRASGKTAYCFIEEVYGGEKLSFSANSQEGIEAAMQASEATPQDDPMIRKMFENDISGERESANFLLVLPAGTAGHIEAGVAAASWILRAQLSRLQSSQDTCALKNSPL